MINRSYSHNFILAIKSERGGGTALQMVVISVGLIFLGFLIANYTLVHFTRRWTMTASDAGAAAGADALAVELSQLYEGPCPERRGSSKKNYYIYPSEYMPDDSIVKEYYEDVYKPAFNSKDVKNVVRNYIYANESQPYKSLVIRADGWKSKNFKGQRFDSLVLDVSSQKDTPADLISGIAEVHGRAAGVAYLVRPTLSSYYQCDTITLYDEAKECNEFGCYKIWVPDPHDVYTKNVKFFWENGIFTLE